MLDNRQEQSRITMFSTRISRGELSSSSCMARNCRTKSEGGSSTPPTCALAMCKLTVLWMLVFFAPAPTLSYAADSAKPNTPPYDCLTTPNGIPKKIIVKKQKAMALEKSNFSGQETPLLFFRKYFVFKESTGGFLVGEATTSASVVGWVRQEDVTPWDTDQAVFFINKRNEGRIPVRIWRSKGDIGKTDKPMFQEQLDRDFTTEPFPIMAKDGPLLKIAFLWDAPGGAIPTLRRTLASDGRDAVVNQKDGDQTTAELLAGGEVSRGTQGKAAPGGEIQARQLEAEAQRMDIVLVIDVTGSMQPYMDQVRARLITIVEALGRMAQKGPQARVFAGVIAYRDFIDSKSTFLTKRLQLTPDMTELTKFLANPELRAQGGGGTNEAVCDALFEACQKLAWGDHSYRVVCLVADAPPHTENDQDIEFLRASGQIPESQFFGKSRAECTSIVKEELAKQRINFYPMSVGGNADTDEALKQLATDPDKFMDLADASKFINALESGLGASRAAHDATLGVVQQVISGERQPSSLSKTENEGFHALNLDPATMAELQREQIQTGWFNAKESLGKEIAVTAYLRRSDLEKWAADLRTQLLDYREKEPEVLKGIAEAITGPMKVTGISGLYRAMEDVAYQPDIFTPKYLSVEDEVKVKNLRRKLNNIMILLYTEKLFSKYDEGWVPMEYVPGSMAQFAAEGASTPPK
jgi:hypothetical protein